MTIIFVLMVLLFAALVMVLLIGEVIPNISGATFMRMSRRGREVTFALAQIRPGQQVVDLGSGDGTLVIEAAKRGAIAYGYEINPFLVWQSRYSIQKLGLADKARIEYKSLWRADLTQVDVVLIFGITKMMSRLERKLARELKDGTRIVAVTFPLPTMEPEAQQGEVYLYRKVGAVREPSLQ